MKKRLKTIPAFCCFIIMATMANAQHPDSLAVNLSNHMVMPGDTLSVFARYYGEGRKTAAATLQMIVENAQGHSLKMRWPILNGTTDGDLIIPDSLPVGKYKITFAVQQKFFRLYGQVNPPVRTTALNTNLLTGKGEWMTEEIPVETDGSFVIKNWLFEKEATLIFNRKNKVKSDLDIKINTWLDSAYEPVAMVVNEFYVGTPPASISIDSSGKKLKPDTLMFNEKANLLPDVIVTGKQKTKADKFNETYSSGMFRDMNERVFDFMSDPGAMSSISVMDYLQGRVAGLKIERRPDGETGATWRGSEVSFFIDELKVDAEQVETLSTADIAILKVYPPPFFGSSGGSGGAIAVYTRRGEYSANTGNRHVFRIKGYTPLQTVLYLK